jgi:hypothetical protein
LTEGEKANLSGWLAGVGVGALHTRVYTPEGSFLGVFTLDSENKQWKAEKTFHIEGSCGSCGGCGRCCGKTGTTEPPLSK